MTKTSIVFTVFVILCFFSSESETKQFCDSFQENGYKIDYTLEYNPFKAGKYWIPRDLLVVIGSDYWVIKMNTDLSHKIVSMEFKSNESRPHYLEGHYSVAFLRRDNKKTNLVGFIRKNEGKIEWKVLKVLKDNCPLDNCIEFESRNENTQLSLPDGFIPSATFVLSVEDKRTKYIAFVDQRPDSSNSSLFTRRYVVQSLTNNPLPDLISESVYNQTFTRRNDLIIGTMVQWDQGWDFPPIAYSRKGDILFCTLSGFDRQNPVDRNTMFDMTFEECSDRKVVIQCPFVEMNTTDVMETEEMTSEVKTTEQTTTPKTEEKSSALYYWVAIIIAIIIVVIVCCFLCCRYCVKKKNRKKSESSSVSVTKKGKGSVTEQIANMDSKFQIMKFKSES